MITTIHHFFGPFAIVIGVVLDTTVMRISSSHTVNSGSTYTKLGVGRLSDVLAQVQL